MNQLPRHGQNKAAPGMTEPATTEEPFYWEELDEMEKEIKAEVVKQPLVELQHVLEVSKKYMPKEF